LDKDGGLVVIVQQAARGQPDGQGLIRAERDGGPGYGIFGIGVADRHQIPTHNGLAVFICSGLIVDFFNRLFLQRFAAGGTLLMAGALAVGGGLLVHDPVAGGVAGGIGIGPIVGIAAAGAGVGGVAHALAGGGSHF